MPVSIRKKNGGYEVRTPNQVHAKNTTKEKAESQARLLNAVEHGWKPTGKKKDRKKMNRSTRSSPPATDGDFKRGYKQIDMGKISDHRSMI